MTSIHSSNSPIDTLGKTGQTIVYIFPDGDALIERNHSRATSPLQNHAVAIQALVAGAASDTASDTASDATSSEALAQQILQSELITSAQYAVACHDQKATGMTLIEVLQMRGWLTEADLLKLV